MINCMKQNIHILNQHRGPIARSQTISELRYASRVIPYFGPIGSRTSEHRTVLKSTKYGYFEIVMAKMNSK